MDFLPQARMSWTNDNSVQRLCKLVLFLLSFTLWIDALTGMVQFYVGVDLKLSLMYKLPMILAMILIIGVKYKVNQMFILFSLLVLLLGPFFEFIHSAKVSYLISDISLTIKVLAPYITFSFCLFVAKHYPSILGEYGRKALWFNFFAVLANLLIGALGFGYPSYAGPDGEGGIGVNGFYVAGNELSGCFVLLFGFLLHYFWNEKPKFYIFPAILTIVCGMLIATKTAMLASILLCFLIPLLNERDNLFKFTKLKLKLFFPLLILVLVIFYFIVELLTTIGLYEKMVFFLQEKGVLGLIFSGRLQFSQDILSIFHLHADTFKYFFGIGSSGVSAFFHSKYSAEVDPVDLYVYFGILGSAVVYICLIMMISPAFSCYFRGSYHAPLVIAVNLILLMLTLFSGHILTSGMLGMLWGMLNAIVFVKLEGSNASK